MARGSARSSDPAVVALVCPARAAPATTTDAMEMEIIVRQELPVVKQPDLN